MEFFQLQKLITALVTPLFFSLLLMLLGTLLRRRSLVFAAIAWLWLWSMPMVAMSLARRVEAPFGDLPTLSALPQADVVLVLGGSLNASSEYPNFNAAADRVFVAQSLYRLGKAPKLLFSGGPTDAWGGSEAKTAETVLRQMGVPAEVIVIEPDSRTTRENVRYALPKLQAMQAQRVLLVTSAWHMTRALRNFEDAARAQNLAIQFLPVPCDVADLVEAKSRLFRWLPNAEALFTSQRMFKESLGLIWARVGGR